MRAASSRLPWILALFAGVLFGACEQLPDPTNIPPVATFVLSPVSPINAGQTVVTFNATGTRDTDGTITQYLWSFGDGTGEVAGPEPVTTHVFPDTPASCIEIVYTVLLTVTDDKGAVTAVSKEAKVVELPAPTSAECARR